MKILKLLWDVLFPKPDYPCSDREIIALIRSELENRHLPFDVSAEQLKFGYVRQNRDEEMVVFCQAGNLYPVVFMNKTAQFWEKTEVEKQIAEVDINLHDDKDHQMKDSFHCWGIFVDRGHFRIDQFRKD